IGILGGLIVYSILLKYNFKIYIYHILQNINIQDIYIGLLKTFAFCQIIGISSCFFGFNCKHTTQDLSNATINSIIFSSISILISNYVITQIFT
ncbi:MAG: ABC transporter permease, partial [Pseudomonadota bacterium]